MGKQKREVFSFRRKMGLRTILKNQKKVAVRTDFGIVVEEFCGIEVGLRIFCPRRRENGVRKFSAKKRKRKKELKLKVFVQVKRIRRVM